MFDFLKKTPKATAEMVADGLFSVLIMSKESEAHWAETFKELEVDPDRGLSELLYLRAVALDIAIITALEVGPKRDEVLSGFRGRLGKLLEERYSNEAFRVRQLTYLETFRRSAVDGQRNSPERSSNPYLDMALKYAEFCGGKDIALVAIGQIFGQYINNAHKFLKSIEIVA
jgi:hypothetical protein